MDSDVDQKVNDRQNEDHEMKDVPAQHTSSSQGTSQSAPPQQPKPRAKSATLPSGISHPPSSTQTTTADPPSPAPHLTNTIMETTEKPTEPQKIANKKRGTATVKKTPKILKGSGPSKSAKTKKQSDTASTTQDEPDHDHNTEELDESDNGPYCICRGPDDHRFMIACDICEDWFHGECVGIDKDVGENLIHRFVCPNCRDESKKIVSIFKLKCSLPSCKKAIRKDEAGQATAFCSEEHSQLWWEMMIAAAPKPKRKAKDPRELEGQSELIAVLNSSLAGVGPDGKFRISTKPFTTPATGVESSDTKGAHRVQAA